MWILVVGCFYWWKKYRVSHLREHRHEEKILVVLHAKNILVPTLPVVCPHLELISNTGHYVIEELVIGEDEEKKLVE